MNNLMQHRRSSGSPIILLIIIFLAVAGGVSSGFALSKTRPISLSSNKVVKVDTATEVGIKDAKTFRDSVSGTLEKGGIEGEGTHHLVRTGGESQWVYLTSSVVDLDQFVGKKVKVYGETFAGKSAGWLMDVGRVELE